MIMSSTIEIVAHGAIALSNAIHNKDYSCREVMLAYLEQIDCYNPIVNALINLIPPEQALAQADECDRQLLKGHSRGWMHGMPQAIKDLAAVGGYVTSLGSPIFAHQISQQDAISVARIRASGAIVIGRSNTPEFGLGSHTYNTIHGTTRNAYDVRLSAGGSSGGAAVAVALRMLPVADGSDMMGSLRNPAGFNNIFGFRPSHGRVPYGPARELFIQQLATEGPMGRSVADIAMLLQTQAGFDSLAPLSSQAAFTSKLDFSIQNLKGIRLGWMGDYNGYLAIESEMLEGCKLALKDFQELGCEVEDCQPDYSLERLWNCWRVHRHWLVRGELGTLYENQSLSTLLKPEARWEIEGGLKLTADQVYQASVDRSEWYKALTRLFDDYDYLLLPTAQMFPFDAGWTWPRTVAGRSMDTYHRWMEVVIGATLAGLPTISVPVGFNGAGLPFGMQIIGRPFADNSVLQLAHIHEQLTGWVDRRKPPLLS